MAAIKDKRLAAYARDIAALHAKWKPHAGQVNVGRSYFRDQRTSLFVQCGRKWGKTEIALYFLWRIAKTFPGSPCYYIAPLAKQAREIIWSDPRIQNFGPREWLLPGSAGIKETEMRLRFRNGSFIKLDGSDNYESYRGPKFKICVYEEYKDMDSRFRIAMSPNAAVLNGVELFIGSPPDRDCEFTQLAAEHRADTDKFYYEAPTWENPGISRSWLKKKRAELYRKGEGDSWEREYGAKFVKGGASKIFPMLDERIKVPHDQLVASIRKDRRKLTWVEFHDPAAASVFGTLYIAYNPYTKRLYALDEIYETDQGEMTVRKIGARSIANRRELYDRDEWRTGYDEAESWFRNEWIDAFPDEPAPEPSEKAKNDKDNGLSLIKDILLADLLLISDRCVNFWRELDNYFKDEKGRIPKVNDHLIDCFRYILGLLYYSLEKEDEQQESQDENFRGARPSDDFPGYDDMGSKLGDSWEDWNT